MRGSFCGWWFSASVLLAGPRPAAAEPPCPLLPPVRELADSCRRDPVPEHCPWVLLIESLAVRGDLCSLPLAQQLALRPEADVSVYLLSGILAVQLMEPECVKRRSRWLLEALDSSVGGIEPSAELGFIVGFENPKLAPVRAMVEADLDPRSRAALERVARGYRDLLEMLGGPLLPENWLRNVGGQFGRSGTPLGLEPDSVFSEEDLRPLAEVMAEFSADHPERGRHELENLSAHWPALLAARAGSVLSAGGYLEDAARVLRRVQDRLEARLSAEERYLLVFVAWLRAGILMEMGFEAEGKELWAAAGNDADPVVTALRQALDPPPVRNSIAGSWRMNFRALSKAEELAGETGTYSSMARSFRAIFPRTNFDQRPAIEEAPMLLLASIASRFEAGDLPGAEKAAEQLVALYPRYGNLEVLLPIARAHLEKNSKEDALRVARRMCDALENQLASYQLDDTARSFIEAQAYGVYNFAIDMASWLARGADAFIFAERGRAFALRRQLGQPFRSGSSLPSEEERRLEAEIRGRTSPGDREALADLREEFERARLARRLGASGGQDREPPEMPVSLASVQSSLAEDELILAYHEVFGPPNAPAASKVQFLPELRSRRLWIWLVTREKVQQARGTLKTEDWQAIDCLARQLRWQDTPEPARRAAAGRGVEILASCPGETANADPASRLYELLIRPVAPWLATGRRLIVVPHGPLHAVPFAALRDPRTGRRLIEEHELAMAPSAAILAGLRQ